MEQGITLKAARVNAGYSLAEVGKILGKSASTIQHIESGRIRLRVDDLLVFSKLYHRPTDSIILPSGSKESILINQG